MTFEDWKALLGQQESWCVCVDKSAVNVGSVASILSDQQLLSTHFLLTHLRGQGFRNREVLQLLLSGQGASGSKQVHANPVSGS